MQNSQTPTNKYDVYNVNRYVPLVDFKVNLFDPDLGEIRSYDFGELYNMFDKKLPSVPKEKPSQEKKPEKVLPEDRYRGLRFNQNFLKALQSNIDAANEKYFENYSDESYWAKLNYDQKKSKRVQYNPNRGINGLAELISKGRSKVYKLHKFFHNQSGFCQSVKRIFLDLAKWLKNFENIDANKPAPVGVTLQNMSLDMMEDLYIYAMGGRFIISPDQFPNRGYSAFLQAMYEEACKIATAHIKEHWRKDFSKTKNRETYYFVDQYIYVCFLIKRTYDVNIFAHPAKFFALAYISRGEDFYISQDLWVVHQTYTCFPVFPLDFVGYSIMTNPPKGQGHEQNFFTDGIVGVYINNGKRIMLVRFKKGYSILEEIFWILADMDAEIAVQEDDDDMSFADLEYMKPDLKNFSGFYDSFGYRDGVEELIPIDEFGSIVNVIDDSD